MVLPRVLWWQGSKFTVNDSTARNQMVDAHSSFMMQEPPADMHRRNVLHAGATHVGIGIVLTEKQFRLVELFVSRHVQVLTTSPDGEPAPGFELRTDDTYLFAKVEHRDWPAWRVDTALAQCAKGPTRLPLWNCVSVISVTVHNAGIRHRRVHCALRAFSCRDAADGH